MMKRTVILLFIFFVGTLDAVDFQCLKGTVSVDFLFWQMRSNGLTYGYAVENENGIFSTEKAVHPHFQPGARISANFFFSDFNLWEIEPQYTYYYSHATDTAFAPGPFFGDARLYGGFFLLPIFMNAFYAPAAEYGEATDRLTLQMIDVPLKRKMCVNPGFFLQPRIGLKSIYINQNLDVDYFNVQHYGGSFSEVNVHNHIKNRGTGLMAGVESHWKFWKCFHLLAHASFGTLWTKTVFNLREYDPDGTLRSSISQSTQSLIPSYEIFIGFSYKPTFHKIFPLDIQIGWEHLYFANLQQWRRWLNYDDIASTISVHSGESSADIAFGGLTVRASMQF